MAVYLLYVVAAIQVINAVTTIAISGRLTEATRDVYAGTEAEGAESIIGIVFIGGAVINLLIGVGFAVLAIFDSRGKNPARIVTWVIGGISLCCFGASLGSTALAGSMGTGTAGGGPSEAEVQRRIEDALPSWYSASNTTLSVLALLAILGTVILLALPAANEFFRKPAAAAWDPSVPYPQYPGGAGYGPSYPAQPPYPGQPFPGQPTSGPSYPGQPSSGPSYPGQPTSGPSYPGQPSSGPSHPGQQGQPGQPAPGLPSYPGQTPPPTSSFPPASDPFAPPTTHDDQPPKPPTDPA
ncbi:hypothetical protein M1L60_38375 [Actinoplanes sp. TRM 88003]|uniref:Uncharacterized protein n=1 Tax=Paractinoplanes aksuensis TaxID=2939490 RepID=A0ABT1E3U3_9ACTN|nr:hypothetical protein [Actinoplanes aksuensis]MCO8276461.1 hypothetical protein [Actinoplanes aksuensis]